MLRKYTTRTIFYRIFIEENKARKRRSTSTVSALSTFFPFFPLNFTELQSMLWAWLSLNFSGNLERVARLIPLQNVYHGNSWNLDSKKLYFTCNVLCLMDGRFLLLILAKIFLLKEVSKQVKRGQAEYFKDLGDSLLWIKGTCLLRGYVPLFSSTKARSVQNYVPKHRWHRPTSTWTYPQSPNQYFAIHSKRSTASESSS